MANRFNQLLCIHATLPFLILVGGGFLVAGWVPPFEPGGSFDELADEFSDGTGIRVAAAMFFLGAAFFVAPAAAIAAQLRKIEGPRQVLANVQMLSAAVGVLGIQIPAVMWLAICYYDGLDPDVIAALNAVAWFCLLGAVGPAVIQNMSIGICVLGSDGTVYPRWLGYFNLYLGFGLMAGVMIPFFDDGPFAWNGVIGFGLVAVDFFLWVILMWIYTVKAINAEEREPVPTA